VYCKEPVIAGLLTTMFRFERSLMPYPVFEPEDEIACSVCGYYLSWFQIVFRDNSRRWMRDCPYCRWYEAAALFTHPIEAYRKRCENDAQAEAWANRVAYATGSAVELRRSPKMIEDDAGDSIGELELWAWLERGFDDTSEELALIDGPRLSFFWRWRRRLREWWTKDETLGGICTAKYIPYPGNQAKEQ
jgi:hypothetical protein